MTSRTHSPCGTAGSGWLRSPPSGARCRPAAACRGTASPGKTSRRINGESLIRVSVCHWLKPRERHWGRAPRRGGGTLPSRESEISASLAFTVTRKRRSVLTSQGCSVIIIGGWKTTWGRVTATWWSGRGTTREDYWGKKYLKDKINNLTK